MILDHILVSFSSIPEWLMVQIVFYIDFLKNQVSGIGGIVSGPGIYPNASFPELLYPPFHRFAK